MNLELVSITGPDNATDIEDLNDLARTYDFLETAVLYDPEQGGRNRFPDQNWIQDFATRYVGAHRAMHLCNTALIRFSKGDEEVLRVMAGFHRIQLNFKFGNAGEKINLDELVEQTRKLPEKTFILQYGEDGEALLKAFDGAANVSLLFDKSAGAGILPGQWPAPIDGYHCGYAGGLNPDNVAGQIEKIHGVVPAGYKTWIDMETGVRTDDIFDIDKVRSVLETTKPHIS